MTILLLPLVLVVGVVGHELCHAAAAKAVGANVVAIDLWNLFVDYRPQTRLDDALVRHAPFVVGVVTLPLVIAAAALTGSRVLLAALWAAFALTGGEGEYGIGGVLR